MTRNIFIGEREFFPGIGKIRYEEKTSDNPLAFKFYDPDRVIGGKTMEEHLRFAVCYWHTFCGKGGDPFGPGTQVFAWDEPAAPWTPPGLAWTRPSSYSASWACPTTVSTIATSRRRAPELPSRNAIYRR